MLIYIYVQDELSFDAHHAKADRIFRIQSHFNFGDQSDDFGLTQFAMVPTLLQEYPEIESGSWLYVLDKCSFTYKGQSFIEDHGYFADTAFFRPSTINGCEGGRTHLMNRTTWSSLNAWPTRCSAVMSPWERWLNATAAS
jgi:putative ABC transport system permease protein